MIEKNIMYLTNNKEIAISESTRNILGLDAYNKNYLEESKTNTDIRKLMEFKTRICKCYKNF